MPDFAADKFFGEGENYAKKGSWVFWGREVLGEEWSPGRVRMKGARAYVREGEVSKIQRPPKRGKKGIRGGRKYEMLRPTLNRETTPT